MGANADIWTAVWRAVAELGPLVCLVLAGCVAAMWQGKLPAWAGSRRRRSS